MAGIGKKDLELAKAGFREAVERGDREEQARWANQVGHACKERGQYVEALKWFRKDYEISSKRMSTDASPPQNLMPTCQSMGEIYLRLNDFEQALIYMRKHYQLAVETDNVIEQQRASTQLGRTYVEIYEQKDDFSALPNAKEYLTVAMDLARTLKENPPSRDSPSFVKELVDAYNNMGLLMMVKDDHKQAANLFHKGLMICNEEELREDDDARSRLHHNLGRLYSERRDWEKAKLHTQNDISICQRIPHPQGEAKGFINLGEIHFKRQRYEDATRCFERALQIAQSLEDEDDLVSTAQKNLDVVCQAEEKLSKLLTGEQQLKKLQRKKKAENVSKSSRQNDEYKLLSDLIGLAEDLQAWDKHIKFAKSLKKVAKEMGDMEKLGDALETVGESYYNLRDYTKAIKWHLRSWDLCKRIGHLEGQSVALINYGNALDCTEEWEKALNAYKDAYDIARSQGKTRMLSLQISALDNMQYCYFVRLEQEAEAKALQSKLQSLKELKDKMDAADADDEHCSETDNESEPLVCSGNNRKKREEKETALSDDDDSPLSSVLPPKSLHFQETNHTRKTVQLQKEPVAVTSGTECTATTKLQNGNENLGNIVQRRSRKRSRVVIDDDDDNIHESFISIDNRSEPATTIKEKEDQNAVKEHLDDISESGQSQTFSNKGKKGCSIISTPQQVSKRKKSMQSTGEDIHDTVSPCNKGSIVVGDQPEASELGSIRSFPNVDAVMDKFVSEDEYHAPTKQKTLDCDKNSEAVLPDEAISVLKQIPMIVTVNISGQIIRVNLLEKNVDDLHSITVDWLKQETVSVYTSNNPAGSKPLLRNLVFRGRLLQPNEALSAVLADLKPADVFEATVDCWVPIPLVERYQLFCKLYQQTNNLKLMDQLKENKDLEEKISASGCDLNDESAWPLLMALSGNGSFSHLDFSHNTLGSRSMKKIQELIAEGNHLNLGLFLDFHSNHLGAGSLVNICECPVILSRLEILNLSGNKLTDAAARYLTDLLKNSKALEVLKIEDCGLTTRSIMKISSAINSDCPLVKLSIGRNNPISSLAVRSLVDKLSSLINFSELDMTGVVLEKQGVEAVGRFLKSCQTISSIFLGECGVQNDGVSELVRSFDACHPMIVRFDISFCELTSDATGRFCSQISSLRSLTYLNLSGNKLGEKGASQIASLISSSECRLKTLMLHRCHLGWNGIGIVLKALNGNRVLQQLVISSNSSSISAAIAEDNVLKLGKRNNLLDKNPGVVCDSEDDGEDDPTMGDGVLGVLGTPMQVDGDDEDQILGFSVIFEELVRALALNEGLKLLDMSENGLDSAHVDRLFTAWTAPTRWIQLPNRHTSGTICHLTADNHQCCGTLSCCSETI